MYAKLIDGVLTPAPTNISKNGIIYQNYNLDSNATMLLSDGYKPVSEQPPSAKIKKPRKYYVEDERQITAAYIETYIEPDYKSKRSSEYPDFREYLDAIVKINSNDETLIATGKTQLQNYCKMCLEIKQKYPKE